MNPLNIHSPHIKSCTSIPDVFFDTYMLRANGEFLKVYLYLYRWCKVPDAQLSVASIADKLCMTESDVMRALRYWQTQNLLHIENDASGQPVTLVMLDISAEVEIQTSPAQTAQTNQSTQTYTTVASQTVSTPSAADSKYIKPSYTMQQIQAFNEQTKDDQIFLVIEQYIGKPLSQNDMNTIIFFYERLGFSPSLIEYLVEYCVGNEHRSLRYMEKVAISWAQDGINSVEKAKRHTEGYGRVYYDILKAFGIHNRGPAATEADYIKKWTETYGFSQSIILEACNRTMSKIHQPSFNYADKILEGWHDAKVHHIEDIQALDARFEQQRQAKSASKNTMQTASAAQNGSYTAQKPKASGTNRFHNFNQRTYNYSDLEQKLAKKRQTVPKP